MAAILVFFCLHSNLPGWPRLWVKNSKEYFNPKEVSQENLNTDKGILKLPPFMKVFYNYSVWAFPKLMRKLPGNVGTAVLPFRATFVKKLSGFGRLLISFLGWSNLLRKKWVWPDSLREYNDTTINIYLLISTILIILTPYYIKF